MKVIIKTRPADVLEDFDYCDAIEIEIDGKTVFSVYDGDTEDNSLNRNFSDCYRISELLEMAFDAGVNGEKLEIIKSDLED